MWWYHNVRAHPSFAFICTDLIGQDFGVWITWGNFKPTWQQLFCSESANAFAVIGRSQTASLCRRYSRSPAPCSPCRWPHDTHPASNMPFLVREALANGAIGNHHSGSLWGTPSPPGLVPNYRMPQNYAELGYPESGTATSQGGGYSENPRGYFWQPQWLEGPASFSGCGSGMPDTLCAGRSHKMNTYFASHVTFQSPIKYYPSSKNLLRMIWNYNPSLHLNLRHLGMINIFWIFQAYNQWGKLKEDFCQELFICSEYHRHPGCPHSGTRSCICDWCLHAHDLPLHSHRYQHPVPFCLPLGHTSEKPLERLFYYKLLLMFPSITVKAFIWLLKLRVSRLCFLRVSSQDRRENITEIFVIQWERWIREGWPPLLTHTRACRVLMEVVDLLPNNQNHHPSGGELPSN